MAKWKNREKHTNAEIKEKEIKKGNYFFTKTMRRQSLIMFISVLVASIALGGSAYAVFTSLASSDYNSISIGSLKLTYTDDETSVVDLASVYPITDAEGETLEGYKFKIRNTGSLASKYVVYVGSDGAVISSDNCRSKLIDSTDLKIKVNNKSAVTLNSLATDKYDNNGYQIYKIAEGTLQPGETKKFDVKMWINIDADNSVLGKHFHGKILVNGENYNTYTTDALKVWYDGINNGSEGNDTTINSWYDLSGNNNHSSTFIGNNTWNSDSLKLNGVVPFVGNINEEYTISTVVKANSISNNPYIVYGDNYPSMYINGSSLAVATQGISQIVDGTNINTSDTFMVTMTYANNKLTIYLNSNKIKELDVVNKPTSVATAYIGGNNGANNLDGNVYNFMLYDKALSDEEVKSNYVIEKARFGIN